MSSPEKIRDVFVKPSTGWWITDTYTNTYIWGSHYQHLKGKCEDHRRGNNLPFDDVEQMIHNQVCAREPSHVCEEWPTSFVSTPNNPIEPPRIGDMLLSFVTAISQWVSAGMPVTPEAKFKQRLEICRNCFIDGQKMWDEQAAAGIGRCNRCGCTGIKLHLETSHCPAGKW
jgi:hypothetical protein